MIYFRLGLLLLTLSLLSCKASKKTGVKEVSQYSFDFIEAETLTDIIEAAEKANKLVFLDVYTDWCLPCQMMDEDVFTNEKLGDYFNTHFVSYKVNAEKFAGPMIAELYGVKAFPTLLFLDLNGRILVSKQGAAYHREMYELADEALGLNNPTGE